jgi:hypothetical protein
VICAPGHGKSFNKGQARCSKNTENVGDRTLEKDRTACRHLDRPDNA